MANNSTFYGVCTVEQLFNQNNLHIPDYQRPYKWTIKNVAQLLDDIQREYKVERSKYRLGTIVFHEHSDKLDIVDGQQRTITLFLILSTLSEERRKKLKINLENFNPTFSHDISKANIYDNYQFITNAVRGFDDELVKFLLHRCELVYFKLKEQSEAFQFFDSQNSRGKDLDPHDLLKAYHLREMSNESESLRERVINGWEDIAAKDNELSNLFENVLFRIRCWSKNQSAQEFTKNDIGVFKGLNLQTNDYPYAEQLKMSNFVANEMVNYKKIAFPFQITDYILNGRGFFEYVNHYQQKYNSQNNFGNANTQNIFKVLSEYKNKYRTGDKYTKILFNCAVLHYRDKFGDSEIDEALKLIFAWAYYLRLSMYAVRQETIDNYALGRHYLGSINIFSLMRDAVHPIDLFNELRIIKLNSINNQDKDLTNLFKELGYEVKNESK